MTDIWTSSHCFVYWIPEHADEFLVQALEPYMSRLRDDGDIVDWFFIRYHENGPHLRVRARCTSPAAAGRMSRGLAELIATAPYPPNLPDPTPPGWHGHGQVRDIPYVREVDRYGGAAAMPVAERVFVESTGVALATIASTRPGSARLAAAADLAMATTVGLGLSDVDAASWLRRAAGAWRWSAHQDRIPPAVVLRGVTTILASRSQALTRRWERVRDALADSASPVARWAACVRSARARLETTVAAVPTAWRRVWAAQLHMLCNRLGVVPDEERSVCWLVAASLLAPSGIAPFFADGCEAADRRYLEASKFAPGLLDAQKPRGKPAVPPERVPSTSVSLPAGRLDVTLAQALRARRSPRGQRLTGPLPAERLGTLLWTSAGGPDRRAYPSAGRSYPVRLRLLAYQVDGIEPGTYQVDADRQTLHRLGPVAARDDIARSSMWFEEIDGGLDVRELPALLAIYADLGRHRATYGLRAVRFALLEAGHVAQNLALVAAGIGLAIGTIGGFYDDLAHELFGLDGVDEFMAYLMPIGYSV